MSDEGSESPGFVMDRDLQRALLLKMREAYPRMIRGFPTERGITDEAVKACLYLSSHGLCKANISKGMNGHISWAGAEITAAGLDFLEDDGGLTAILGVVTVKLHAETIRQLVASKIENSELPEEEKSLLRKHLAGLSQTALQAGTSDLVRMGLDHLPNVAHWLGTL